MRIKNKLIVILFLWMLPIIVLAEEEGVAIKDPLDLGDQGAAGVLLLINRFVDAAFSFSGVLALLSFIYGGVLYLSSSINPDNVKKAKDIMKNSLIGLVILFSSYAIINFVLSSVLKIK